MAASWNCPMNFIESLKRGIKKKYISVYGLVGRLQTDGDKDTIII
jgi:hypothetical protein